MSASRDQDQAIERLLRASLKTPQAGVTDACLDAETLAALSEGGLSGAALEIAQTHLADCARCQSVLGALVRVEAIAPAPAAQPAPRRWLAWLVPFAVATAAIALWIVVPRGPGSAQPQIVSDQSQVAQAKPSEPAVPAPQPQQSFAPKVEQEAAPKKADQPSRDQAPEPELRKDAGRLEVDRLKQQSAADQRLADADKAAAAPVPSAPSAAPAAREELQATARSATNLSRAAAIGVPIVSPDPAIRWRIEGSVVERSTDGGSQWNAVPTGLTSELTGGSAPSTTVFWVVGRGGIVLRTTDGRTFSRVPFPELTDLSAIQATDARSATVTASDGRVFTTSDGGATWASR